MVAGKRIREEAASRKITNQTTARRAMEVLKRGTRSV
jgi:hypothetical protein